MVEATALRIVPQSMTQIRSGANFDQIASATFDSAIDFYESEYKKLEINYAGEFELHESQRAKPIYYDRGKTDLHKMDSPKLNDDLMVYNVIIRHKEYNTLTKITSLVAYDRVMKLYYKYNINNASYEYVIIDPGYDELMEFGEYAQDETQFKFYKIY